MIDLLFSKIPRTARLALNLFVAALSLPLAHAAAPAITQQPVNNIAATNEDISFTVSATGDEPLAYQWLFNGGTLGAQTNSFLLLTNLNTGQAGNYSVVITNLAGSITSSNAFLTVSTNVVHRLGTGRIVQIGTTVVLPIFFRNNGRENAVSFSLAFDTNVFSNPTFTKIDVTAVATTDTSQPGVIGVALTLPSGATFSFPGYEGIGLIQFDLAAGKSPLSGSLNFVPAPIPIAAVNTNGQTLNVVASVLPQFTVATAAPALRLQSGLFEHQLFVSNPGATVMTNVNILPLNLGVDSRTNQIKFFNAQVSETGFYPYFDPLISVDCNCACGFVATDPVTCTFNDYLATQGSTPTVDFSGTNATLLFAQLPNLQPGESRTVTVEYYVTDHATVPAPAYSIYLADPFALTLPGTIITPLTIDIARYVSNSALVEFSTHLGNQYFVQWSDTAEGLSTGKVVFPQLFGTGSRVQWIDNGPPKTDTPPTNHNRFYRVLSDQR
jgi:hypothetical protein